MQKTNIKASILIWATFLSLIITVTFVSISTSINKNLKNNSWLTEQFKIENQLKNIIASWSIDSNFRNVYLDNWDKIIFDTPNKYIVSLNKWATHTWQININSNVSIKVLEWWPIIYKQNSSSWIVLNLKVDTFPVTISPSDELIIKNLWWYSKIQITSDTSKNYLSKYRKYTIYKKIWNKEIIKRNWLIKNF